MMDVCRLCLSKSPDKDISQLKTGQENDCKSYHHILQFCLNIEVDNETQISKKICTECFYNVLNFYKFKTLALKTDAYWRCEASKVLVKHEALEEEEVFVSEVTMLENPEDYNFKYESGTEDETDLVNNLKDDLNKNYKQFYNEELMNENVTDDESGNSSDADSIAKPQLTQDNENENLGTDEEFVEEEKFNEKKDPMYKPPKSFGAEPNITRKSVSKVDKEKPTRESVPKVDKKKPNLSLDYPCEICNSKFSSYFMKRRHRLKVHRKHMKSKKKCLVCNKEVINLQLHTLKLHEPHKLKYLCECCGRRFVNEHTKSNHLCPSTNIRCHICSKQLASRTYLKMHIRTVHEEEKRLLCEFCSKKFFEKAKLERHLRSHTKERPYKCTDCDRSYADGTMLKIHQQGKHSDIQFPCTRCVKVFANKMYLYNHMRNTHNNKNSFECGYSCGLTFTRLCNCRAHEKRKHGATLTRPGGTALS